MDAFPESYAAHNIPLVVLSGIKLPSHGARPAKEERGELGSQFGSLDGDGAAQLLNEFLSCDGTSTAWNGRNARSKGALLPLKIQAIGPTFKFPPKKAAPPTNQPGLEAFGSASDSHDHTLVLHSPISPLSPNSPLYPDGLMTPLWTSKHQDSVPAVFVSCFAFESNPSTNSLHDNQLKSEINRIKGALAKSEYRTRYAVVLLGGKSVQGSADVDERMSNIRRATGLDAKSSLFFVPAGVSAQERPSLVVSILSAISPLCIEYYRDLTKHSRRKKGRGTIPSPTLPPTLGTSQALPAIGWNVRYEFKLGVFAEFRQEMDAASRHYISAIEALFAADGPFQTTPTWSPRWDEVRLLADVVALRNLRCMLWNGQTTSAVQFYAMYREQSQIVIDQRGKGTACYGWQAWESRWAKILAELIQRAELPWFTASGTESESADAKEQAVFSPVEKAFPVGERISPWQHLHHPGYWLLKAATHAKHRKQIAMEIPDEDRNPPGQSPAGQVAHRAATYDTYLCPEPHVEFPIPDGSEGYDHTADIVNLLNESSGEFFRREQRRFVDHLRLQTGKELFDAGAFDQALATLKPLWKGMRWRSERWWDLVNETTYLLNQCAHRVGDIETILETQWELLSRALKKHEDVTYDFMRCLDGVEIDPATTGGAHLDAQAVVSPLHTRFAFEAVQGHVADTLTFQLELEFDAHEASSALRLEDIIVEFEGPLQQIKLSHQHTPESSDATDGSRITLVNVDLVDDSADPMSLTISSATNLTMAPGKQKVFQGSFIPRRSGELKVTNITYRLAPGGIPFRVSNSLETGDRRPAWWLRSARGVRRKHVTGEIGPDMTILPKPPKIDVTLPNLEEQYYTDETVVLHVDLANHEEEEATGTLHAELIGRAGGEEEIKTLWSSSVSSPGASGGHDASDSHPFGPLSAGQTSRETITFTAPSAPFEYALELQLTYQLQSDQQTPLSKTVSVGVIFVGAFEASYEFAPRLHPEPWPSYFHMSDDAVGSDTAGRAQGIAQEWGLGAHIVSFAEAEVTIESASLSLATALTGAVCSITPDDDQKAIVLQPRQPCRKSFDLTVRKSTLDDRRAISLDVSLEITWRRSSGANASSESVTSTLGVPRLLVPNSEPRVLAHAGLSSWASTPSTPTLTPTTTDALLIHLSYTLENPSLHYLTFDIAMDASSEFAFSGPKVRSLNLLPMSRRTVEYVLYPLVQGDWVYPSLRVQDRYFNKTLRVIPAKCTAPVARSVPHVCYRTYADVKVDKRGICIWIPTSEEQRKDA
ncbi:hypothetical protein P152DRAFT_269043 [Eremomyces bilateralis CBS 781.70]|uniref:Uncharacterized protein n=1 Tax=Eremomyces bilateralis CBS 781.70 TaxID=1392243 RepID=A0A6G1G8K7_9PEZI|nr:uncharacterized protein P152DRAFT_269043 [Eremomyces bilateralis CBS 781.70]KAF1814374.1 hypothetical protein P152DRAFT_269043 [Eremomyces bilateralis CBS 781.70]